MLVFATLLATLSSTVRSRFWSPGRAINRGGRYHRDQRRMQNLSDIDLLLNVTNQEYVIRIHRTSNGELPAVF
jgi:hypothetical protein